MTRFLLGPGGGAHSTPPTIGSAAHTLVSITEVVVASALLAGACGKLLSWDSWVAALGKLLARHSVTNLGVAWVAIGIAAGEAAIALGLAASAGAKARARWAWGASVLSAAFVAVRLSFAVRGEQFRCPCFGRLSPWDQPTWVGLTWASLLLAGSLFVALRHDSTSQSARRSG